MSDFNADDFMNETVDQPLETEFKLCPAGEYPAMIDDFGSDAVENFEFEYKRGPRAGEQGSMKKLTIPFVIQDEKAKAELNRDKVVVTKQLILDVDAAGRLDFGTNKNIALGQVRNAVGQNNPGPWSIGNLKGAGPVMVKVEHINFDRKDGTKGKRAEVTRVVRLS